MSKYFIFTEYETHWIDNEAEWKKALDDYDFLGIHCDDGWDSDVENVFAGIAPNDLVIEEDDDEYDKLLPFLTHRAEQCDVVERPDEGDLDEEMFDKDGEYWGDYSYRCNYFFIKVENQ